MAEKNSAAAVPTASSPSSALSPAVPTASSPSSALSPLTSPALPTAAVPTASSPSSALSPAVPTASSPSSALSPPDLYDFIFLQEESPPSLVLDSPGPYFPGRESFPYDALNAYTGNHLPHWSLGNVVYHICFRLADSVPAEQQRSWLCERQAIVLEAKVLNRDLTAEEKDRLRQLYSEKIEHYLLAGYGKCYLRQPQIAKIVQDSLEFNNNKKYLLHAWCIMPNHLHLIMEMMSGFTQAEILQGWKSYTAHIINQQLGRSGQLWQTDSYNHIIRSEAEYYHQMRYVWCNPERAGWQNWPWRWTALM